MNWFLIALSAPALWAGVNHLDKYIVDKYSSGESTGFLVIFTSLNCLLAVVLIFIFKFPAIFLNTNNVIIITLNGALLVASYIPYVYALEKDEASMVSTLFQLIPVFSYFLALIFLDEHLSLLQIIASLLIVFGAMIISMDLSRKTYLRKNTFLLMCGSSLMIAIAGLIFKIIAIEENFWGTSFWEYFGGFLFGVFLLVFVKPYRNEFIKIINKGGGAIWKLNICAESLNIVAKLLFNYATLLAPLALVWAVNGFQPLLVFIYGIILTVFKPQWGKEKISRKIILQKVLAMILIFIGTYFLLI